MSEAADHYPPGLPEHLRAWYDSVPVDDEPLDEQETADRTAALAETEPGISTAELLEELGLDDTPSIATLGAGANGL